MADDLAGILASGGPLGPAEMQAQIYGQQAADPRVLATSSNPVGQLIGQLRGALVAQPAAMSAAQNVAGLQSGAMADLGRYAAATDPLAAAAADTGGNAAARWMMLGRTNPLQIAQTREALANAAYRNLLATGGNPPTLAGPGAGPPQPGARAAAAPSDRNVNVGAGTAKTPDLLAGLPSDPDAAAKVIADLPDWQREALRGQIVRRKAGTARTAPPGATPPTANPAAPAPG